MFFILLFLFLLIFISLHYNLGKWIKFKKNILISEYGGNYIFFKNYKDILQYYNKKTRIHVPYSDYSFSCARNLDGSLLFMVETDKHYNFTIRSCAVFHKDKLLKTFNDLNIKFFHSRFNLKPPAVFYLFNKLGYPISEFTPGDINYKNYSRFGMYYFEKSEVKDKDDSSTISLYSRINDQKLCDLKLPTKYRMSDVLEINDGVIVIFVNKKNNNIILNSIHTQDKFEIKTNQYDIPNIYWGYTSLVIEEYNPNGSEFIIYTGQELPLKGALFLLDTVKGEFKFITRLYYRWHIFYIKD